MLLSDGQNLKISYATSLKAEAELKCRERNEPLTMLVLVSFLTMKYCCSNVSFWEIQNVGSDKSSSIRQYCIT